jgi:hypothetical protein
MKTNNCGLFAVGLLMVATVAKGVKSRHWACTKSFRKAVLVRRGRAATPRGAVQ